MKPLPLLLIPLVLSAHIESFAVYYGSDRIKELKAFDLVVLSPLMAKGEIEELDEAGVLTFGYVSITTVGGWEPWAKMVDESLIVSKNGWNERVVNASSERWREIILGYAIPYLKGKGFKGVFFDNLDLVDLYPWMKEGIVKLVKGAKEEGMLVMINRGFSMIKDVAPYVDAALFECFGTHYDFESGRYEKYSGEELDWLLRTAGELKAMASEYGFTVLALGYGDPEDEEGFREFEDYVADLASKYGFPYYVSDVNLQYLNVKPSTDSIPYLLALLVLLPFLAFILFRRRLDRATSSSDRGSRLSVAERGSEWLRPRRRGPASPARYRIGSRRPGRSSKGWM